MDMELTILVNGAQDFSVAPPLPGRWRWLVPARFIAACAVLVCVGADLGKVTALA
jgi:hypothetical protein